MEARQQTWPRMWLMTDERMGERLWDAIERLPATEAGIVFRHYSLGRQERRLLAERVADLAHRRGITLGIARDTDLALSLGAKLVHNPSALPRALPFSRSVHSMEEARRALIDGAALVFVSPVHPTRSHPDREALGVLRAAEIAAAAGVPAIALGGMNARNFADLPSGQFYGWAGIDAWM